MTDIQIRRQKGVRGRQYHSGAARASEFAETFPETGTGRIEDIKSLH